MAGRSVSMITVSQGDLDRHLTAGCRGGEFQQVRIRQKPWVCSLYWWTDCHGRSEGCLLQIRRGGESQTQGAYTATRQGETRERHLHAALRGNRLHRGRVLGDNAEQLWCFDWKLTLFWRVIWRKPKEILSQKLGSVLSLEGGEIIKGTTAFHLFFSFWNFNFLLPWFSFVNWLIGSQKVAKID